LKYLLAKLFNVTKYININVTQTLKNETNIKFLKTIKNYKNIKQIKYRLRSS
jgi:hypothetical protein